VTALADGDASTVRNDFDREADLCPRRSVRPHDAVCLRINAIQGNDVTPSVQYWRGREGEVDFVF